VAWVGHAGGPGRSCAGCWRPAAQALLHDRWNTQVAVDLLDASEAGHALIDREL
jgi:hypothetical protein